MSAGYIPREGGVAHRCIEHMKTGDPGQAFRSAELADAVGAARTGISTQLRKALDAGLVVITGAGSRTAYSLPAEPEPGDGTLVIATYSDGDVSVLGGMLAEDGSIMYTREQVTQLVQQMTRPHVPVASTGAGA